MQGVETLGKDVVERQQRRTVVSGKEGIHKRETELIVEDIEIPEHIGIMDVGAAESDSLIEYGECIPHRPIRLLRNHMERLVIDAHSFLSCNASQIGDDVRD